MVLFFPSVSLDGPDRWLSASSAVPGWIPLSLFQVWWVGASLAYLEVPFALPCETNGSMLTELPPLFFF